MAQFDPTWWKMLGSKFVIFISIQNCIWNILFHAHGEHELNTPAPQPSGNFHQQQQTNNFNPQTNFAYNQTFSQNNVGGPQKPFSQGGKQLLKLKLCFQFQQKNYCSKQDNCTFAHGEHELNTPQPSGGGAVGVGGAVGAGGFGGHGGLMNQGHMNQGSMGQGGMNPGSMGQGNNNNQGNNNPKAMGSQNFGEMTYFG